MACSSEIIEYGICCIHNYPSFQCSNGMYVGLAKETSQLFNCGILNYVIQCCLEEFFDTIERKNLTTMEVETMSEGVKEELLEHFKEELIEGLLEPSKEELESKTYEILMDDTTLLLPGKKIQFMMELGGFLESKCLHKGVDVYLEKLHLVFDNFELLSQQDYYLRCLVYVNHLTSRSFFNLVISSGEKIVGKRIDR
ncbi:hypothetical protein RHMOL_Rhmol02G0137500 [Rhododendron molle]|uniref:Uncharacterized protein n=1 Tax=Rhododendron molle TaxID=49168 RepID=A0ACC0PSI2_RHOML|nr:hypothetical protein RHMOL_Rhmol02G0137500 [Rhododendron molle]